MNGIGITIKPTEAGIVVELNPTAFGVAYSPGLRLHVVGYGETRQEATGNLARNLRELADRLNSEAEMIEAGK